MRKHFVTGLLIWVPLAITLWILHLAIGILDQSILLLPEKWHPKYLLGFHVPGLGSILTLLIIFVTGLLAQNIVGTFFFNKWEALLQRIPLFNSLYSSVKQISDTLFSSSGNAFRTAVLVQYPHQGTWTIGFITGSPGGDVKNHLKGEYVSIYVPTTPNPTSGFFLMLPKTDVIELNMSVDKALKYIVSMGVVTPDSKIKELKAAKSAPDQP